jgi:hypothetical protein
MGILNLKERRAAAAKAVETAEPKGITKILQKEKELADDKIPMEPIEDDGLPLSPTSQQVNFLSLGWLFVGPPGFGKSEFFGLFPDALMLSFEAGHKFITCYKVIVDAWDGDDVQKDDDGNSHMSLLKALELIESSTRFKFIIIDTLDAMVKKCSDWHVEEQKGAKHLVDLGDYGKGFDVGQNTPIRKALNRLYATGRGIGLITHQQINTNTFTKGNRSKKETALPNGIWKIVYPQCDVILHGEFGEIREGNKHRDRIIFTEGNEDMLAKNRGGMLPPAWLCPLDMQERITQLRSFFEKEGKTKVDEAYEQYKGIYEE